MAALHRINPQLQQLVSEAALPLGGVVSYCRPWFEFPGRGAEDDDEKDKKGWKILELNVQRSILEQQQQELQMKELEKKVENEGRMGGDGGKQDTKYGLVTSTGEILAYTILRSTLQHVLRSTLQRDHGIAVQFEKRLIGISYSDEVEDRGLCSNGIQCHFADGSSSGPYDIVVGCDGIGSAVREYVNTGNIDSSSSSSTKKVSPSSAIYSGLRITFAIHGGEGEEVNIEEGIGMGDENVARPTSCQFNQFFGNGAYALTSTYGAGKGRPPAKGAFLVYPDPNYIGPFPRRKEESALTTSTSTNSAASVTSSIDPNTIDNNDTNAGTSNSKLPQPDENPDWSQDKRITKERILDCLQILQDASVPGKDASNTIEQSTRFFDLGVYLHNPFSWNGWVREVLRGSGGGNDGKERRRRTGAFAVTAGDASHAMPPFLGQGANQALQE
jgi:salicylate hydroxylase